MENSWQDYDFEVDVKIDDIDYFITGKILNKGTIFQDVEEEWEGHYKMGSFVTGHDIEELPQWEIRYMNFEENGQEVELKGAEEVNAYFTMNPDKREKIESWMEKYCEDLADDALGTDGTFAYDVHVKDEDYYYRGPETDWERDN